MNLKFLSLFFLIAICAVWSESATAQSCNAAEAARQIGVRNMDANCSGPRASPDQCYDAARLFISVNGKNGGCPGIDRRELAADLARANQLIAQMRSRASGVTQRSNERVRIYNAPRGNPNPAASSCRANLGAECAARCGGNANCQATCVSGSAWRCN